MPLDQASVLEALKVVRDPDLNRDIVGLGFVKDLKVEGGREKIYSVDLKQIPTGPSPEQVAKRKGAMSSFGARVNPVGGVTADFGSGFPYYFMARATEPMLPG